MDRVTGVELNDNISMFQPLRVSFQMGSNHL